MRHKRPALRSIGLERDERVIRAWQARYPALCELVHTDAHTYLANYAFTGSELVYCDPPYLPETRSRSRVYRYDYSVEDHECLLALLKTLPCMVVVSGYPSALYGDELRSWQQIQFSAKTHAGQRVESLWFNFDPPTKLHDHRFLGSTFRERELIKRRLHRLRARIRRLSDVERQLLRDWINAQDMQSEDGGLQ